MSIVDSLLLFIWSLGPVLINSIRPALLLINLDHANRQDTVEILSYAKIKKIIVLIMFANTQHVFNSDFS